MKIGPLFVGWHSLAESDRITLGLDAWIHGWKVFCVEWRDHGITVCARPRQPSTKRF